MEKSTKTNLYLDSQELAGQFCLEGTVMEFAVSFNPESGYWKLTIDTFISDEKKKDIQF